MMHFPRTTLEGSALRICARHDPRHLHMASHVGADAQDMSWLTGLTVALQGVRVAGVTKPLHGGLEPARTTHDEVHGWDTRTQDRLGTTSLGAVPYGSCMANPPSCAWASNDQEEGRLDLHVRGRDMTEHLGAVAVRLHDSVRVDVAQDLGAVWARLDRSVVVDVRQDPTVTI